MVLPLRRLVFSYMASRTAALLNPLGFVTLKYALCLPFHLRSMPYQSVPLNTLPGCTALFFSARCDGPV